MSSFLANALGKDSENLIIIQKNLKQRESLGCEHWYCVLRQLAILKVGGLYSAGEKPWSLILLSGDSIEFHLFEIIISWGKALHCMSTIC